MSPKDLAICAYFADRFARRSFQQRHLEAAHCWMCSSVFHGHASFSWVKHSVCRPPWSGPACRGVLGFWSFGDGLIPSMPSPPVDSVARVSGRRGVRGGVEGGISYIRST